MKYLVKQEVQPDHLPQVQGQLWISEREWCDWWMYHPDLPRVAIRTYRDETYIKDLTDCLEQFRDMMSAKIETPKRGQFEIRQPVIESFNPEMGEIPQDVYMAG